MIRLALVLTALALLAAGCGAADEEPAAAEAAGPLPATAVVVCGPAGVEIETPEVAARPDGVHVEIRNETGGEQVVQVGSGVAAQGEPFPAGTHTRVFALPPGEAAITCHDPAGEPVDAAAAQLEIVDPDGVWVSTDLGCDDVSTAQLDYFAGAPGMQGDPAEVVRADNADRLEPGDVVEPAGYPDAEDPATVRVVREGRVISVLTLVSTEDGGWLVSTVSNCTDAEPRP